MNTGNFAYVLVYDIKTPRTINCVHQDLKSFCSLICGTTLVILFIYVYVIYHKSSTRPNFKRGTKTIQ